MDREQGGVPQGMELVGCHEKQGSQRRLVQAGKDYPYEYKNAKFDLLLSAGDTGNQLVCSLEYSTLLYKEERVKKYIAFFQEIIQAVLQDKTILLKDIPLSISSGLQEAEQDNSSIDFNF